MKSIIQILTLILLFTQTVCAQIITVKQDSTGDYTLIQDAINASSDGDTVLVWPGTYFENVDFAGKNITLASRMIKTNDPAFKYNTIIDGNHNGTCVLVNSDETNVVMFGFTIQNGSGYDEYQDGEASGGGLFIKGANCKIVNCIIKNNFANNSGGGIVCAFYATLSLVGSTVCHNHAYSSGGGIALGYETNISIDTINLCSIYSNYSAWGCEFNKLQGELYLKLDTSTVLNPDSYFFSSVDDFGFQVNDLTFNIQHEIITPADTNLYVNPLYGDDSNNGLSWEEPLKTIAYAYSKIAVDSLEKNTIYLADGIYSDTMNGEKFPLNIRPYINVEGQSRDGTILDGEYKSKLLKGNNDISEYSFSKMTLRRGTNIGSANSFAEKVGLAFLYFQKGNILFDSVLFSEGRTRGGYGSVFPFLKGCQIKFKNCEFRNYVGDAALRVASSSNIDSCLVSNCIFQNDSFDESFISMFNYYNSKGIDAYGKGAYMIVGTLITGNERQALISPNYAQIFIVNCTFSNNANFETTSSFWLNESSTKLFNCIVYQEGSVYSFTLSNTGHSVSTNLSIQNSLIENGEEAIFLYPECDGWCSYHYDPTNIDTDPLFLGKWEHPYQIADGSPCIDVGTLANLPDFIELPETDLAGNPRIVGDSIDMGAYEWNPTVGVDENLYQPVKENKLKLLQAAPNPFNRETTISAQWDFTGHVQIDIYNNAGLRVKVLKSGTSGPGSIQTRWDGKDQNENILPKSIYHIIMFWNGKEVDSLTIIQQ